MGPGENGEVALDGAQQCEVEAHRQGRKPRPPPHARTAPCRRRRCTTRSPHPVCGFFTSLLASRHLLLASRGLMRGAEKSMLNAAAEEKAHPIRITPPYHPPAAERWSLGGHNLESDGGPGL